MKILGGYRFWKRCPGSRAGFWERSGEIEGSVETSSLENCTVRQRNRGKYVTVSMDHPLLPQCISGNNLLVVTLIGF